MECHNRHGYSWQQGRTINASASRLGAHEFTLSIRVPVYGHRLEGQIRLVRETGRNRAERRGHHAKVKGIATGRHRMIDSTDVLPIDII